jgi:hypothetical protein
MYHNVKHTKMQAHAHLTLQLVLEMVSLHGFPKATFSSKVGHGGPLYAIDVDH